MRRAVDITDSVVRGRSPTTRERAEEMRTYLGRLEGVDLDLEGWEDAGARLGKLRLEVLDALESIEGRLAATLSTDDYSRANYARTTWVRMEEHLDDALANANKRQKELRGAPTPAPAPKQVTPGADDTYRILVNHLLQAAKVVCDNPSLGNLTVLRTHTQVLESVSQSNE